MRASPAARSAPPSMKNISIPMLNDEHRPQERQRLGTDRRRGVDEVEQVGDSDVAERRQDAATATSAVRNAW